jgi:hypothetical protein
MRLSHALTLLIAVLAASPAAALDCARAPKKALPGLVARFMKNGEKTVLHGVVARVNGGGATPVMSATFKEGDATYLFYVAVKLGDSPDEVQPDLLLLAVMTEASRRRERWIFQTDLSGKMTAGAQVLDALDEKGGLVQGEEEFNPKGPHDPETAGRLDRALKFLCRAQARGLASAEETAAGTAVSPAP